MKYIDADQIRAEIVLAKAPAKIYIPVYKDMYGDHLEIDARWQREANDAFDFNIEYIRKDLVDTLPEQPVTNCNWLVSEINKKLGHDDWLEVVFDRRTLIDFAGHFYALGLNARKDE